MSKKVLVPFADGFEDIEAVSIVDVLRRGGVEVVTASLNPEPWALSAHGIRLATDAVLMDVLEGEYDAIILPGGGQGTQNLKKCLPLLQRLNRQKKDGKYVCAICAAPTVLVEADVIEDETVTCYPSCAVEMGRHIEDVPVIADGLVITGQGPASATLFGLVILAHLVNEKTAHNVANGMLADFG